MKLPFSFRDSLPVVTLVLSCVIAGKSQNPSPADSLKFSLQYPTTEAGVLIQNLDWVAISAVMPIKTRAKHGIAASLSYGAVAANVVSEYDGPHAQIQIALDQPAICLCHLVSIPGDPVIVRLHPKKTVRELDGGRMRVYPVVGGSKNVDANQSDLIRVNISQPEKTVWLIRPAEPLPAGEYALMLGTQNVAIYPFTVGETAAEPAKKQ